MQQEERYINTNNNYYDETLGLQINKNSNTKYKEIEKKANQRNETIKEISEEVIDVHALMIETKKFAYEQQYLIDSIADHFDDSKKSAIDSEVELIKARKHQRNRQKCCCTIITIICLILVILILFFVLSNT